MELCGEGRIGQLVPDALDGAEHAVHETGGRFSTVGFHGRCVGAGYEFGFADLGLGISPAITYSWVREAGNGPELLEFGIGVTWPRRFRRSGGSS